MKRFTLLLIFGLFGSLEATFSKELIKKAASKCCTPNRQECCIDMIKFGTPIRCGYEEDPKIPAYVYKCLQQELFAEEPEKRMNFDDSYCCTVFGEDSNDQNKRCESACKSAMTSPSIDASTRLTIIRQCSLLDNPLYSCFNKCRELRRADIKIEVLRFEEYCNSTWIQKREWRRRV